MVAAAFVEPSKKPVKTFGEILNLRFNFWKKITSLQLRNSDLNWVIEFYISSKKEGDHATVNYNDSRGAIP